MKRLSRGDPISEIKRDVRKSRTSALSASFSAMVSKCPNFSAEHPCSFSVPPLSCESSASISSSTAHDCSCSCCHSSLAASDYSISLSAAASASDTSSAPFESFSCAIVDPKFCLDKKCDYLNRPIYRREARYGDKISSPVAGGGDAFVEHRRRQAASTVQASAFDDFADLAILDSGANRHTFGNTRLMTNHRPVNLRTTTADGSQVRISEEGDVIIPSVDEHGNRIDPLVLRDVSVMRGSPINLISVGVLCKEGSSFHFSKGDSYFIHEGRKVQLIERNGLYLIRLNDLLEQSELDRVVQCEVGLGHSCPTEVRSKTGSTYACAATWELWHERFGHASKKRLKFLFDNGAAEGMAVDGKYTHDRKCTCPTCLSVNNAKVHIGDVRKFGDTVTQRGELIYTDVCGLFPTSVEG